MKLYAKNLREGQKNQYIFKTRTYNKDEFITEELWETFSQKLEGFYTKKVAPEKHRFAVSKEA